MHYVNKNDHPDVSIDGVPELSRRGGSQEETGTESVDGSSGGDTPEDTPEDTETDSPENPPNASAEGGGDDSVQSPPFDAPGDGQDSGGGSGGSSSDTDHTPAEWYECPEGYYAELDGEKHSGHPTGWLELDGSETYNPGQGKIRDDGRVWHVLNVYPPEGE